MRHVVLRKCTLYNFYNHYLGISLGRVKTLQAFSPVIPGEILFQKINCGCFVTHSKVLSFPPKQSAQDSMESLWKLFQKLNCGFFFFRRTQSFPPEKSAQDSTWSLRKFCSKKSTVEFSSHAKFSLSPKTECPRFHGELVEIQTSQPHQVHVNGADASAFYR